MYANLSLAQSSPPSTTSFLQNIREPQVNFGMDKKERKSVLSKRESLAIFYPVVSNSKPFGSY